MVLLNYLLIILLIIITMTMAVDFALCLLGSYFITILVIGMCDGDDDDKIVLLMIMHREFYID